MPRVSSKPFCFPDILNAWHGNPAHNMSCLGISASFKVVISPNELALKLMSYVLTACLLLSILNKHWAPNDSKANLKPPIPQNKSINVIFYKLDLYVSFNSIILKPLPFHYLYFSHFLLSIFLYLII